MIYTRINYPITLVVLVLILSSCGSYRTFTGTVSYDASKNNQVTKSSELNSYLGSKSKIKFVLRVPEGYEAFTKEEKSKINNVFSEIEKELIKQGHIVKDRILMEKMLSTASLGPADLDKLLETDVVIEVINIDFDIPNQIKNFRIKEKGIKANFDYWQNLNHIDCRMTLLECRVTLVEVGNVAGIFKLYISGCDQPRDFYLSLYETSNGEFDGEKESFVGWNFGNINYTTLTHTYNMNEFSRQAAVRKLVESLLVELDVDNK